MASSALRHCYHQNTTCRSKVFGPRPEYIVQLLRAHNAALALTCIRDCASLFAQDTEDKQGVIASLNSLAIRPQSAYGGRYSHRAGLHKQ